MSKASPTKFIRRKKGEGGGESPRSGPLRESPSESVDRARLEFAELGEVYKTAEDRFSALQYRWKDTDIGKELTQLPRQVSFMLRESRKIGFRAHEQGESRDDAARYESARLRLEHLRYSTSEGRAYTDAEKILRRSREKMSILQEEMTHASARIQINITRTRIRTLVEEISQVQDHLEVLEQYILQQEAEHRRQYEAQRRQDRESGTIGYLWEGLGRKIRGVYEDLLYKRQGIAVADDELTRDARTLFNEYGEISSRQGKDYASEDVQRKYEEHYQRLESALAALQDRLVGIAFDWDRRMYPETGRQHSKIFRPKVPRKIRPIAWDLEASMGEQAAVSELARWQMFEDLARHNVFNDLRCAQRESGHTWTREEFMHQALNAVNGLIERGEVDEEFRGEFLRILFSLQDEEFWNWSAKRRRAKTPV